MRTVDGGPYRSTIAARMLSIAVARAVLPDVSMKISLRV